MNFDEAITAHARWKTNLAVYISNPDHGMNASVVGSPNECELGKWINGEGKKVFQHGGICGPGFWSRQLS